MIVDGVVDAGDEAASTVELSFLSLLFFSSTASMDEIVRKEVARKTSTILMIEMLWMRGKRSM